MFGAVVSDARDAQDEGLAPDPWPHRLTPPPASFFYGASAAIAAIGAALTWSTITDGRPLQAAVAVLFFGGVAIIGVGGARALAPAKAVPELVNAVILSDANEPPADSWVHLFRQRRAHGGALLVLFTSAIVLSTLSVLGFVENLRPDKEPSDLGWLLPALILVALALLFWWAAIRSVRGNVRSDTVGERPVGVTVGEAGIGVHIVGVDSLVPWTDISSIAGGRVTVSRKHRRELLTIDIVTRDNGTVRIPVPAMKSPAIVLYTALLFYTMRPEARKELGTTVAHARMEAWCAEALHRHRSGRETDPVLDGPATEN